MNLLFSKIYEIFSDLRFIFSKQFRRPRKVYFFLDYLRILSKKPFDRIFHFDHERFLTYQVKFTNYHSFFQTMFREIFVRNSYYFESASNTPRIIDCGSNIGLSVLYFKYLYPQAKILAFEPSPTIFPILKDNINKNKLGDIKLINKAVARVSGTIHFFFLDDKRAGGMGATTIESVANKKFGLNPKLKKIVVPAVQLSEYINDRIDLLKLDIEGGEGMIIEELDTADKLKFVREIILEYHYDKENTKNSLAQLLGILERRGFNLKIFSTEIDMPINNINRKNYHFMVWAYRDDY